MINGSKAAFAAVLALAACATAKPAGSVQNARLAQAPLLPVSADVKTGKILLTLPAPDPSGVCGRFIYMVEFASGLGSARIGLDRAQESDTQILVFRCMGGRVLAEFENTKFRAKDAPDAEQAAVKASFAASTVWAAKADSVTPGGATSVDIAPFLTRDAMHVADALKAAGETGFKLVPELSAADPAAVKSFPDNLVFEARQTFASETPGPEISNIAPDPRQITLVLRHNLVRLPAEGYVPRKFDPRTGSFSIQTINFAARLGDALNEEFAVRFRLEKTDPGAARSPVKRPIVFYIDRAAPEPIRTALLEGASWWGKAFEAAGYEDAFRAEILPEGADPLDIRYNVINWVNRATRGWSYGQAVADPRTGEIIKGSVLLGSLRVRQDMLIFEGLAGADRNNTGASDDPVRISLARLRQLSAHETGHALGFQHNFAGSTQGRASVMDYPPPRIALKNGKLDFSEAYAAGIGTWDAFTVDWLYGAVPDGPAGDAALDAKVRASLARGERFVADGDSRPQGSAHPYGGLWDDGPDAVAALASIMRVRRAALERFGMRALHPGEPVANLRRKIVPVFLLHRYEIDRTAKLVGGVDFAYSLAGDGKEAARPVPAAEQRRALAALLGALAPQELQIPPRLVPLLSAGWTGNSDRQFDIELFAGKNGAAFDALIASETAAGLVLNALLAPSRLNRLEAQRHTGGLPDAHEVLAALIGKVFEGSGAGALADVGRRVQLRTVLSLEQAARDPSLSRTVAADIEETLQTLAVRLRRAPGTTFAERAQSRALVALITDRRALKDALASTAMPPAAPPGMPIGSNEDDWFGAP